MVIFLNIGNLLHIIYIYKKLANIILRLFKICINSASLERLFSTIGFFHSKRYNKLEVSNIFYFIIINILRY